MQGHDKFKLEISHISRIVADTSKFALFVFFYGLDRAPSLTLYYPDLNSVMNAYDLISQAIIEYKQTLKVDQPINLK